MYFKKFIFIAVSALFFTAGSIYSADSWRIYLANFKDLSPKPDKSTGTLLKKSVLSGLQKDPSFMIVNPLNESAVVDNYKDALNFGHTNKADIIIFGDYYIEAGKIIVNAEVFDLLENRTKTRRFYTGVVTIDVFDTIDKVTVDLMANVKEALPPLTDESEIRIKKIRQNVYESSAVTIKRLFLTRFGVFTEFGPKTFTTYYSESTFTNLIHTNTMPFQYPYSSFSMGGAFRFSDFRFDFTLSGLPAIPVYDGYQNKMDSTINSYPTAMNVSLVYYTPFFSNNLALGIGMNTGTMLSKAGKDLHSVFYDRMDLGPYGSIYTIFNPIKELELRFSFIPWLDFVNTSTSQNHENSKTVNTTYTKTTHFTVPSLDIGLIWFFGDFGLETSFLYNSGHFEYRTSDDTGRSSLDMSDEFTTMGLYAGMVYRVDFLNTGNNN